MARHAKRERPAYSKVIVATCLVLILAFTATCFVYLWWGKPLNDLLTGFFFACFGLEFASLAFIKRGEIRYESGGGKVAHVEKEERDVTEAD